MGVLEDIAYLFFGYDRGERTEGFAEFYPGIDNSFILEKCGSARIEDKRPRSVFGTSRKSIALRSVRYLCPFVNVEAM